MKHPTLLLCALLVGQTMAFGQANMTHEETVVRTAYAKFAYASEQRVIGDLVLEALDPKKPVPQDGVGLSPEQRIASSVVNFALKDFVVGDVRDILDRSVGDIISPAAGEMITTNGEKGMSYSEAGVATHWECLEVQWQPARPTPPQEVLDLKLADLYRLEWQKERPDTAWQRYASYTVTVTFQGKSRGPYKALFLFGHDEHGNEVIQPEDATTNDLVSALHEHLFPDSFVLTTLRKHPIVADWLSAKQRSDVACSVGQADVCCDLAQLKCGPGREDVSRGLAKDLPGASLAK